MHTKDTVLNFINFFIKLYIYFVLVSLLGVIKATILSLILLEIYKLLLKKLFGLEEFSNADLNFVAWEPERQYNIPFVLVFEGTNKEGFKKIFIERGIKHFHRLRQKMTFTLGSFYWKEYSQEEAVKQIKFIEDKDAEGLFESDEKIMRFGEKLVTVPFEKEEFQWRLHIADNKEANKTIVIIQADHSMWDGFGLLCLISKLTDNFDFKNFPRPRSNKTWMTKLKENILVPFFIPFSLYLLFGTRGGNSPFKIYKDFSINKETIFSKKFDFPQIYKVCKKINVTFNDYILCVINAASKKYAQDYEHKKMRGMTCLVPVNLRPFPEKESDLRLTNESTGVGLFYEFIDDPIEEADKIKSVSNAYIRHHLYTNTVYFLNSVSNRFLPFFFSRNVNKGSAKHFDFVISNVPGPAEKISMSGMLLNNILCLPNPGPHSCFIAIFTYLNKVQINFMKNNNVECDSKVFMSYLEKEIESTLQKME